MLRPFMKLAKCISTDAANVYLLFSLKNPKSTRLFLIMNKHLNWLYQRPFTQTLNKPLR